MSWKLGLLGTGTTLRRAPLQDETFQWWGVSPLLGAIPQLNRVVEVYDEGYLRDQGMWPRIVASTCPVYMQQRYESVPMSRAYPFDAVRRAFTLEGRVKPFVTSTIGWLLALALLEDEPPAEIHPFGVDMVSTEEYDYQREGCAWFLGVAHGRGIRVVLQVESDVLKAKYLYGLEQRQRAADVADFAERERWFRLQRDDALLQLQSLVTRLIHTNAVVKDNALHRRRAET